MSSSESEDDFESASEGDDSSSYEEDDDEASDNEDQLVLSSAIPVDQTQEVKLAHSVDNNVVTSSLLENVSTQDEKQTEPPVPTTERPSTYEERSNNTLQHLDVKVQDKTAAAALTTTNSSSNSLTSSADEISPNNTKQPAEVQETVVLAKSLELVSISSSVQDQIRKSENIPSEIQEPIQSSPLDDAIPVDIVTKISTRSVSSRVRPSSNSKPKQTLGAKKLGGVKLSQPFENNATAPLDHDTEESLFPTKVEKAPHQTHQMNLSSVVNQKEDGGGWGGWFAPPKLLSSVTSFTTQILSTVENGLNIPEPEDLAKEDLLLDAQRKEEDEEVVDAVRPPKETERQEEKTAGFSQLMGGVSNITRFVESTGSSLFSTGLGTLEAIGKKTIDVLQQTDPGLKRTKAALGNPLQANQDLPCLSQILREAKETNETEKSHDAGAQGKQSHVTESLTTLFEHHQGIVHMEALEMLSQQCQSRIAPQIRRLTAQRRTAVEEIAQLCSRVSESDDSFDPDEFDLDAMEQNLASYFDSIGLQVSLKKLMDGFRRGFGSDPSDSSSVESCYSGALNSLALVTSLAVELLHKSSELLLTTPKSANPAISGRLEAEAFNKIVVLLEGEITRLGGHHANQIIIAEHGGKGQFSTDIYYEASNCAVYVQNAFKQMIPILQSRFF